VRYTILDAATAWDVDKDLARGVVKLLEHLDLAAAMGERRPENGRGRPEVVYEFRENYAQQLAQFLARGGLDECPL